MGLKTTQQQRPVYSVIQREIALVIYGLIGLICYMFVVNLLNQTQAYEIALRMVPIMLLTLFSIAALRMITSCRILLLTPLPLLFGYAALIFGLGPLVMYFGPEYLVNEIQLQFAINNFGYYRVLVLNLTGLLVTFFTIWLGAHWLHRRARIKAQKIPHQSFRNKSLTEMLGFHRISDRRMFQAYLAFFAVALLIRVMLYGYDFNINAVLPGFLVNINKIGWLAIFLAGMLAGKRGGIMWVPLILILVLEVGAGTLALVRRDMLTPILVAFLGLYIGGRSIRLLIAGVVFVFITMIVIRPIVDQARTTVWSTKTGEVVGFYKSLDYARAEGLVQKGMEQGAWWGRLNYAPIQGVLMRLHDTGRPGDTFEFIPWTFVPRFLSPGKPEFNTGGRARVAIFNVRDDTAIGTTVFGEAYWNGGWLFVIWVSVVYGFILMTTSAICLWLFNLGRLSAWPLGFMGVLLAFTLTNTFSTAVVGGSTIYLYLVVAYFAYVKIVPLRKGLIRPFTQPAGVNIGQRS